MSDIERRGDRRPTRREREDRAYRLVLATGGFSLAAVVSAIVAVITPLSMTLPVLAAVFAIICFVMLRRVLRG